MNIEMFGEEFDVPDYLVNKFIKDFDKLPGGKNHEAICTLRESIDEVLDVVYACPDIIEEQEYLDDFIKALAMREALAKHGILFDA